MPGLEYFAGPRESLLIGGHDEHAVSLLEGLACFYKVFLLLFAESASSFWVMESVVADPKSDSISL